MPSHPDRARALRAVRRRRNAYHHTQTAALVTIIDRQAAALSGELGYDFSQFTGMTADLTRPHRDHETRAAARARAQQRLWAPVFERVFLNTQITALDTSTISTA